MLTFTCIHISRIFVYFYHEGCVASANPFRDEFLGSVENSGIVTMLKCGTEGSCTNGERQTKVNSLKLTIISLVSRESSFDFNFHSFVGLFETRKDIKIEVTLTSFQSDLFWSAFSGSDSMIYIISISRIWLNKYVVCLSRTFAACSPRKTNAFN